MRFFRDVVVPRYKRIGAQAPRPHGIDLWYTDCDGDVRPLLPVLPRRRHQLPVPLRGQLLRAHPASCSTEYGKELRIMGGVDKMELGKGREAIKPYLETLVPLGRARRLHPLLRPPLPAQREARTTTSTTST